MEKKKKRTDPELYGDVMSELKGRLLQRRRHCYPLTLSDFESRYLLACEALSSTTATPQTRRNAPDLTASGFNERAFDKL